MGRKVVGKRDGAPAPGGEKNLDYLVIFASVLLFFGIYVEFIFFRDWNQLLIFTIFMVYGVLFIFVLREKECLTSSFLSACIRRFLLRWKVDLAVCTIFSITAFLIGYFLLAPHGPGLSDDSLNYIVTGINLNAVDAFLQGRVIPAIYTMWPPLYPAMIAALIKCGISPEEAARLIPLVSFSLLMFPLFFLGERNGGRLIGYATCTLALVFYPFWYVTSWAWSEMPFIFFSVASVLFITYYLADDTKADVWLFLSAVCASLAALTRYMGLALIIANICVIVYRQRQSIRTSFEKCAIFIIVSGFPIGLWLYRNIIVSGYWTGHSKGNAYTPVTTHLTNLVVTIINDFVGQVVGITPPHYGGILVVSAAGIILLVIAMLLRKDFLLRYPGSISPVYSIPLIAFVSVYTIVLLVSKSVWKLIDPIATRLISPVYPFLMVLLLVCVALILRAYADLKKKEAVIVVLCGCGIILLLLQISTSLAFFGSIRDGQGYNDVSIASNSLIQWVTTNVTQSEGICVNAQIFMYLDYKYGIPSCTYTVRNLLATPNLEYKILDIFEMYNKLDFIVYRDSETSSDDISAFRNTLQTIAIKNNMSFEYFENPNPINGYTVLRMAKHDTGSRKEAWVHYNLWSLSV